MSEFSGPEPSGSRPSIDSSMSWAKKSRADDSRFFARRQVSVHRLGQRRVAERVALALLSDQRLIGHRLAQGGSSSSRLSRLAGAGEQVRAPPRRPPTRRHPTPACWDVSDNCSRRVSRTSTSGAGSQGWCIGGAAGMEEWFGVIHVALGPVEDPPHGHVVDRWTAPGRQVWAHLLCVEGNDVETLDDGEPVSWATHSEAGAGGARSSELQ